MERRDDDRQLLAIYRKQPLDHRPRPLNPGYGMIQCRDLNGSARALASFVADKREATENRTI